MINNCPGCGQTPQGPHRPDCPTVLLAEQFYSAPNLKQQQGAQVLEMPKDEAEYRRVWLEIALRTYVNGDCTIALSFDNANRFLAELKKRDGT